MKSVISVAIFLVCWPANAELLPNGGDWSDISHVTRAARAAGLDILVSETELGESQLSSRNIVLFAPKCSEKGAVALLNFVRKGARLAIIAERKQSNPCLSPFGVMIDPIGLSQTSTISHPDLYPAHVMANAPFAAGARVLANRPARLIGGSTFEKYIMVNSRTIIGGIVKEGAGQLAVVSDTSVFINSMNSVLDNRRLSTELLRWVAGSDRGTVLVFGPEHSQYMAPVMSKNESPIQGLETHIFSDERILLLVSMLLGIVVLTVGFQVLIPLGQMPKARSHWSLPFTEVSSESAQDVTTHSNRKDGP